MVDPEALRTGSCGLCCGVGVCEPWKGEAEADLDAHSGAFVLGAISSCLRDIDFLFNSSSELGSMARTDGEVIDRLELKESKILELPFGAARRDSPMV